MTICYLLMIHHYFYFPNQAYNLKMVQDVNSSVSLHTGGVQPHLHLIEERVLPVGPVLQLFMTTKKIFS